MNKESARPWVFLIFGASLLLVLFSLRPLFQRAPKPRSERVVGGEHGREEARGKKGGDIEGSKGVVPAKGAREEREVQKGFFQKLFRKNGGGGGEEEAEEPLQKNRGKEGKREIWLRGFREALLKRDRAHLSEYLKELSVEPALLSPSDLTPRDREVLKSLGLSLPQTEPPSGGGKERLIRPSSQKYPPLEKGGG